MIIYQI
jgi:NAD(P)-dependent dehydrogenase (short-subunit alcohol dehydrogenase family)